MAATTLVVFLVVISLLRRIQHLKMLGSIDDSLLSAKERTRAVLLSQARTPRFNNPGTAIETLLVIESLLWEFSRKEQDVDEKTAPNLFVCFPGAAEFAEAGFAPIARDGAGRIEVALTLRRALSALSAAGDQSIAQAAGGFAKKVLLTSQQAGLPERDLEVLKFTDF